MAALSYDQLYAVINGAFGDLGPDVVALMTAIAMAESGGNAAAHNNRGEDSRGIGQINIGPGANTDLAGFDLFDPAQNAKAMRIVYDRQGPGAWSVYSNGMYQQYMNGAPTSYGESPEMMPVPLVQQAAEPSRVMAPQPEKPKQEAQPLIEPWRIGPPDWSMIAPLVRQGGANAPFADLIPPGTVPLIPRLGGM